MIALALALALPQEVPDAAPEDEIVVIARKLKDWRANVRFRRGKGECKIKRSTGDKEIDRIGCDAMLHCLPIYLPRYEAARDKTLAEDARKEMTAAANRDMTGCVKERHETLSAALADRRASKGAN